MAAVAVMALVIDAIQTTVSSVIGASLPSSRRPNAPSYSTPLSVAAMATIPGIFFDSTASLNIASTVFRLAIDFTSARSRGVMGFPGPLALIEGRHGFPGTPRALGVVGGHFGAPPRNHSSL